MAPSSPRTGGFGIDVDRATDTAHRQADAGGARGPDQVAPVLEALADAAVAIGGDGIVTAVNQAALDLLGADRGDVVGRAFEAVVGHDPQEEARPPADCLMCQAVRTGVRGTVPTTIAGVGGDLVPVEASVGATERTDEALRIVVLRDIRAQRDREAMLVQRASLDATTGLPTRQTLLLRVGTTVPADSALLLIDLDGFNDVNDRFGHPAGDDLLSAVAGRLRGLLRDGDLAIRYGGDEFAVHILNCAREPARALGWRIIDALNDPFHIAGRQLHTAASVGIALSGQRTPFATLLKEADRALREAKANGKACAILAGEPLTEPSSHLAGVSASDARAWASYIRTLRSEIAEAKDAGRLPAYLAAPEPIHRTLLRILASIDALPQEPGTVDLPLPHPQRLLPFVLYQTALMPWIDRLLARGLLHTERPTGADRFLTHLGECIEPGTTS